MSLHRQLAVFSDAGNTIDYDSSELVSLTRDPRPVSPRHEIQEVTVNLSHHTSPSGSHLETLQRPVPMSMTLQEASFHRQTYTPRPLPPYRAVTSPVPPRGMSHSSLRISPHHIPRSPSRFRSASSLPCRPPIGSKVVPSPHGTGYTPHPFQAVSTGMMVRRPEPISWMKYPVEPHHIYPGPYAAVDVPFEDNDNPSGFDVPVSSKAKLSSTWGPQKLRCLQKSRKCVRFASTWGPNHPARAGVGEYATINPKKLTSRYVRPAIFRRSNLKIDPRHEHI